MVWKLQMGTDVSMWSGYDWFSLNLHPHLQLMVESLRSGRARSVEELADLVPGTHLAKALCHDEDVAAASLPFPSRLVFPDTLYPLHFVFRQAEQQFGLAIDDPDDLAALHDALSGEWATRGSTRATAIAEGLFGRGMLGCVDSPKHDFERPGIYRLQHAALMFRTTSACLLTDYVLDADFDNLVPPGALPANAAVAITHGHGDHFSLPTLLQLPRATPIIVPRVACHSMLGICMESILADAGFENVVALSPGETFAWFDIIINAHPFYGEQPWINFGAAVSDLRNSGLTYVVEANGSQSWVLADSGPEFGHDMADLSTAVTARHGRLDHVFSNLREFFWHPGQIDSSGRYLFCFDRERLFNPDEWPNGKSMTLGPSGIARVLDGLEATTFRPYAHWWHEPGSRITVDTAHYEQDMVANIGQFTRSGHARLENWHIGDRLA